MYKTKLVPFFAAIVLSSLGAAAHANVIHLSPLVQETTPGSLVVFDVHMTFLGDTVGGAFDVFYTPETLGYLGFEFNPAFLAGPADPDFAVFPDDCFFDGSAGGGCNVGDAEVNGIGFGNFDGITGEHTIGALFFVALAPGGGVLSMASNDEPWGGFFGTNGSEMLVHYNSAKVGIVPIPAGIWLFASGLGLFAGFARRRRN